MTFGFGFGFPRPAIVSGSSTPPVVEDILLLTNGVDALLLTDGVSFLKLASSP